MCQADRMKTRDLAPVTREFLFALAYWVTAADHVLKDAEREWLDSQFGVAFTEEMLKRLSAMEPGALRAHIKALHRQVLAGQLPGIHENIRPWLRDLMLVDGERAVNETVVAAMVLKLLGLKSNAKRRSSPHESLKPFKGWPNPTAGISRSSFEIH